MKQVITPGTIRNTMKTWGEMSRRILGCSCLLGAAISFAVPLQVSSQTPATDASPVIRTPSEARVVWMRDSATIRSWLREAKALEDKLAKLDQDIPKRSRDLKDLEEEKKEALEDLRNGRFCSECGRSATQLNNENIHFETHVREVGGVPRGATPERIAEEEAKYDKRIEELSARLKSLRDEEHKLRVERSRIGGQIDGRARAYHENIRLEASLRHGAWVTEKLEYNNRLYDLRNNISWAQIAVDGNRDDEATEPLLMNLNILHRQFEQTKDRADTAYRRADQNAQAFIRTARQDQQRLADLARTLTYAGAAPAGGSLAFIISSGFFSCNLDPVADYVVKGSSANVRSLLENHRGAASAPATEKPQQSVRELLEGK